MIQRFGKEKPNSFSSFSYLSFHCLWSQTNLPNIPPFNSRLLLPSPPPQGHYIVAIKIHSRHTISSSLPWDLLVFLHPFAKPMLQISSLASNLQNPRVRSQFSKTHTVTYRDGNLDPTRRYRPGQTLMGRILPSLIKKRVGYGFFFFLKKNPKRVRVESGFYQKNPKPDLKPGLDMTQLPWNY